VIYVAHRPELLKATDTDGDGRADTFDALGGQWGISITTTNSSSVYGAMPPATFSASSASPPWGTN